MTTDNLPKTASQAISADAGRDVLTEPRPGRSAGNRLQSLTGLRFLAALLVFFYHSSLPRSSVRLIGDDGVWKVYYIAASQAGALGVTFFFVLSGFVLTWSARPGDTARSFWRRRYVKIVPNYVLTWALAMVLFAAAITPAWMAGLNLFMLQSWLPNMQLSFSVDTPSWSLGVEAVFYALFPLLLPAVRRIRPERLAYWALGTVLATAAVSAFAYAVIPAHGALGLPYLHDAASADQYWFAYVFPIPRIFDFALGILVARMVMTGRWRDIGAGWAALLLVAAYGSALVVPYLYGQTVVCLIPIALLIAAFALADGRGRRTFFSTRAMVWLGEISFAFYLVHWIVLATVRKELGTRLFSLPVSATLIVGEIGLAIGVAWLLYAAFERPIVRRWSSPRRRVPSDAPAGDGPAAG